jgi:hypothetical protein
MILTTDAGHSWDVTFVDPHVHGTDRAILHGRRCPEGLAVGPTSQIGVAKFYGGSEADKPGLMERRSAILSESWNGWEWRPPRVMRKAKSRL